MEKLEGLLEKRENLILVGSSYGGLMAAVYACLHESRVARLILLAPALNLDPYAPYRHKQLTLPVTIVHGLQDDVVPLAPIRTIAEQAFVHRNFLAVDDDHSLHKTFATLDWDRLLSL